MLNQNTQTGDILALPDTPSFHYPNDRQSRPS